MRHNAIVQAATVRYRYARLFLAFLCCFDCTACFRLRGCTRSCPISSTSQSSSTGLLCLTGSAALLLRLTGSSVRLFRLTGSVALLLCLTGSIVPPCHIGMAVLLCLTGSADRFLLSAPVGGFDRDDCLGRPVLAGPVSFRGYKSMISTSPCLFLPLFFGRLPPGWFISHNTISVFLFRTLPCTIFPTSVNNCLLL